MRLAILAPLALVACATTGDSNVAADAEFAKLTTGRVAGPVVDCVQQIQLDGMRLLGDRRLIARGGNRIWVNDLPESCPGVRSDSIPIIRTFNGEYCRNDQFTPAAPNSIPGGSCRLGAFTPYTKN